MSVTLGLAIIGFFLLCLVYLTILLVKNDKICEYNFKALGTIDYYAKRAIHNRKNYKQFFELYYSYPSYDKMLFSLTKWKYTDFYGDLENKCKELLEKED